MFGGGGSNYLQKIKKRFKERPCETSKSKNWPSESISRHLGLFCHLIHLGVTNCSALYFCLIEVHLTSSRV